MIAVILGGGEGKRLKKIFRKPKFLIEVEGKTLIDRQIKQIEKTKKIKKIFLSINEQNFENENEFNLIKKKITPLIENKKLGTAGCLSLLKKYKFNDVLVIFGDLLLDFDFNKLLKFHKKKNSKFTAVVHPNNHPIDSDMVEIKNEKIVKFHKKPHRTIPLIKNRCLSGIFVLNKKILKMINQDESSDISKNLIPKLLKKKINIFTFENTNFIKDMGTPERYKKYKKLKIIDAYNRPAIFLDRDGVLNREYKNEKYSNPLKLFPKTIKSLKLINDSKYLAIVITNQPAVAKNFISEEKLNFLHRKLENFLSYKNVYLNDIYYCPHHPKKGFENENKKLKKICNCRKPNNGLIKIAKKKYNIDLKKSFFIGNSKVDFLAAKKSNVKPIMINYNIKGVKSFNNLFRATKYILKN